MKSANYKYDLIIFDCDGTIVDSEKVYSRALSETLTSIGHPEFTIERCVETFTGLDLPSMLKVLEKEFKHTLGANEIMKMIEIRNKELSSLLLKPIENAHELIKDISLKKCVASNGQRHTVLNSLMVTKLDSYFPENNVFTYEQVKTGKPAPDLFLYSAEKMLSHPSKCLVIEDSVVGIRAAKAANMKVIAFTGASHNNSFTLQKVHDAEPDFIVNNLLEVLKYI